MAFYRSVNVGFWQDSLMLKFTPNEKYFYLYLLTNSHTTQCGIYELSKRTISNETGFDETTVDNLIEEIISYGKFFTQMTQKK